MLELSIPSRSAAADPVDVKPERRLALLGSSPGRCTLLRSLLPEAREFTHLLLRASAPAGIACWVSSRCFNYARGFARTAGYPLVVLDDALLRGPRTGFSNVPLVSLTVLEGKNPLGLDGLLQSRGWETPELLARAGAAIHRLVTARLGGDCWAPDPGAGALGLPARGVALVVAQDDNDPHLPQWHVDQTSIQRMLDAATAECGARDIVVFASSARSSVVRAAKARGWRIVTGPISPWTLLDSANRVYTAGHEIGFLALLSGKTVRCFGRPFYAGWGATEDDDAVVPRGRRSVAEIFAATCLFATRFADPFTGRPCSFEDACGLIADWHRVNESNRRIAVCTGMSFWKRRRISEFVRSTDGQPAFRHSIERSVARARSQGGAIAVWGARERPGLADAACAAGVSIVRVEDGFVRSVGLGADFMPAASVAIDRRGIYYDPTSPSDLEAILIGTEFDPALLDRARRLMRLIVARGVTKYNTGGGLPDLDMPTGRRRIFVPGQVEDDRSVILAGKGVTGNLDLLTRVRERNPEAFIVYKPHPDVDAGHRAGAICDEKASRFADRIVRGVSSAALIAAVDEVHTLTSLAGFEALLRDRRVVVYGQPFYAGWGLTLDLAPVARRQRHLRLEELVAGALILYPRYIDPLTRLPCGPEVVIERLGDADLWRPSILVLLRRFQGIAARRWRSQPSATPVLRRR